MKIKDLLFIVIVFLVAALVLDRAFSAPSLSGFSGDANEGSSVSLSGTSFGANGPTLVLLDRMEGGVAGSSITTGGSSVADYGQWAGVTASTCAPIYSTTEKFSGSQAMYTDGTCGTNGGELYARVSLSSATKVFYCFDWKTVGNWHGYGSSSGDNVKFAWLTFNNDTTDTDYYYAYTGPASAGNPPNQWLFDGNDGSVTKFFSFNTSTTSAASGSSEGWKQNCVWLEGDGNSNIQFWEIGSTGTVRIAYSTSALATTVLGDPTQQHTYWTDQRFPGFLRLEADGTTTAFYQDNIYVSTGNASAAAHIWLMDQSTLFTSTKWALQEPQVWSDTSISFKFRRGPFTNGQTAYLYVCDANFSCNTDGYPVTVGSSSSGQSTIPAPPAGTANTQINTSGLEGIFRTRTRRP